MPAFVWKGKTRDGKAVSGERNAENKEAVMALLRRDQILVSSVKEKGKEIALPKLGRRRTRARTSPSSPASSRS